MSEVWSLPGYDVVAPMGADDLGELWRAREQSTGDVVALKRLHEGVDPAAVEQVREQLPVLRSLPTPHLVRLRAVVGDGANAVLVLDHAPGGSLASLLARRGTLEPGEVVTVAAPLASALAVAHARGVVHGDVSAGQVLFAADGMPLLGGLGLVLSAPGQGRPEEDVRALARLCHVMLAGRVDAGDAPPPLSELGTRVPRALATAVERGLGLAPASPPDAAAFATLLRRAHPTAPVRLTGRPPRVASPGVEARPRERLDVRTGPTPAPARASSGGQLAAVGVVLLIAVGAAGGWAWGRSAGDATGTLPPAVVLPSEDPPAPHAAARRSQDAPPADRAVPPASVLSPVPAPVAVASADTAPARPSAGAAPDWPAVLDELDTARAAALARADAAALHAVHAPSSPALAADTRLVEQLAAAGHRAVGVRHAFRAVEVLDQREDRVRLRLVDVLAAHEVRDADGEVVRRAAARADTASVAELARTPAGWRIVQITAA